MINKGKIVEVKPTSMAADFVSYNLLTKAVTLYLQIGNHEELKKKKGFYWDLIREQETVEARTRNTPLG